MAIAKRTGSKRKTKRATTTTTKKKKSSSAVETRSYTVLKTSKIDRTKNLSKQGKTVKSKKTGAYVASKVALAKRPRPSRVYLYRNSKIRIYSISYLKKEGKVKAFAKHMRTVAVKRKKGSSPGKKSKSKSKTKATCTCAVKNACKKSSKPVFRVSGNKLNVLVNGRRSLVSKSEIDKLKKKLVKLTGSRRRSA